jgi:hypothetical protein
VAEFLDLRSSVGVGLVDVSQTYELIGVGACRFSEIVVESTIQASIL